MINWHDPAAYQCLAQMDRAGLMWEWLRRDPAYRSLSMTTAPITFAYLDSLTVIKLPSISGALRWGLHFR
jgi:hypothetical protein